MSELKSWLVNDSGDPIDPTQLDGETRALAEQLGPDGVQRLGDLFRRKRRVRSSTIQDSLAEGGRGDLLIRLSQVHTLAEEGQGVQFLDEHGREVVDLSMRDASAEDELRDQIARHDPFALPSIRSHD